MGGSGTTMRVLGEERVLDEICRAEEMTDRAAARSLARSAIAHLGGQIVDKHSGGLRAGQLTPRLADVREEWLVPAKTLRD